MVMVLAVPTDLSSSPDICTEDMGGSPLFKVRRLFFFFLSFLDDLLPEEDLDFFDRSSFTFRISSKQHSGQWDRTTVHPPNNFFLRNRTVG